jgi:hypothetical protein
LCPPRWRGRNLELAAERVTQKSHAYRFGATPRRSTSEFCMQNTLADYPALASENFRGCYRVYPVV